MAGLPFEFILYAALGGIVPTLVWLYFWHRRDRFCPEPTRITIMCFLFGAIAALFAIPFQTSASALIGSAGLLLITVFAFGEELAKYLGVKLVAFRDRAYNERIDPIIYLVTAALGFAAGLGKENP